MARVLPTLTGAGAFVGSSTAFISGSQSSIACQPGWNAPVGVGNIRVVSVTSADAAVPAASVSDGTNSYPATAVTIGGGAAAAPALGAQATATPVTYQATISKAATAVDGSAPPVVVTFTDGPATSPSITIYEFLP